MSVSVSRRVAEEMDVTIGEVGYSIRFEDCSGAKTVLKYLTDDMLQKEAMTDPLLECSKIIILDEVHERTRATSVLFGLLRRLLKSRSDLKLVVMSATLEAGNFQEYFDMALVMKIPTRLHPERMIYRQERGLNKNYADVGIRTAIEIHKSETAGDILFFLTGEKEIDDACRKIRGGN